MTNKQIKEAAELALKIDNELSVIMCEIIDEGLDGAYLSKVDTIKKAFYLARLSITPEEMLHYFGTHTIEEHLDRKHVSVDEFLCDIRVGLSKLNIFRGDLQ